MLSSPQPDHPYARAVTAPEVELGRAWRQVVGDHPPTGADEAWARLLARHRESHRRYHTATHLLWVVRHIRDLWPADGCLDDLRVALAAALYHDAVYDPRSSTNEHDSAEVAGQELGTLGWAEHPLQRVRTLIEATAGHLAPDDETAPVQDPVLDVLLDADLAVLGAEPTVYEAYVRGIRAEYRHLDNVAWRRGRSAVLHTLLARPTLYRTHHMRAARERRARANLAAELAVLERPHYM